MSDVLRQWTPEEAEAALRQEAASHGATIMRLLAYPVGTDTKGHAMVAKRQEGQRVLVNYDLFQGRVWLSAGLVVITDTEWEVLQRL